MPKPSKAKSLRAQQDELWSWFEDFVRDGDLLSFTEHAGISLKGVPAANVWDRFRDHYSGPGGVNVEKFGRDLLT